MNALEQHASSITRKVRRLWQSWFSLNWYTDSPYLRRPQMFAGVREKLNESYLVRQRRTHEFNIAKFRRENVSRGDFEDTFPALYIKDQILFLSLSNNCSRNRRWKVASDAILIRSSDGEFHKTARKRERDGKKKFSGNQDESEVSEIIVRGRADQANQRSSLISRDKASNDEAANRGMNNYTRVVC